MKCYSIHRKRVEGTYTKHDDYKRLLFSKLIIAQDGIPLVMDHRYNVFHLPSANLFCTKNEEEKHTHTKY